MMSHRFSISHHTKFSSVPHFQHSIAQYDVGAGMDPSGNKGDINAAREGLLQVQDSLFDDSYTAGHLGLCTLKRKIDINKRETRISENKRAMCKKQEAGNAGKRRPNGDPLLPTKSK